MESVIEKSAALTPQLTQAYVDVIGLLVDGVIQATPDQINNQVVRDVDTMLFEVAKCSQKMASFGFDFFYEVVLGKAVGDIVSGLLKRLINNDDLKITLKNG